MPKTLAEFIEDDMLSRGIESQREYGRFVGCAGSTIGQYLAGADPTIDFLRKLSRATGVSLRTLLELSYPEIRQPDDIDPAFVLALRGIKDLPKSVQDFILTAIRNAKTSGRSNQKDK